jgi:hypothetical protein
MKVKREIAVTIPEAPKTFYTTHGEMKITAFSDEELRAIADEWATLLIAKKAKIENDEKDTLRQAHQAKGRVLRERGLS